MKAWVTEYETCLFYDFTMEEEDTEAVEITASETELARWRAAATEYVRVQAIMRRRYEKARKRGKA